LSGPGRSDRPCRSGTYNNDIHFRRHQVLQVSQSFDLREILPTRRRPTYGTSAEATSVSTSSGWWLIIGYPSSCDGLATDTTAGLRPLNVFDAVLSCSMASTFPAERAIVVEAGTQHRCTAAE
jgi:hypothetical protein